MFRLVPWADALYAIDAPWWKEYGAEVRRDFAGLCFSSAAHPGVRRGAFPHFSNSGCAALSLAAFLGARRIVMVGYDCQRTGGQTHSHGDHPKTLGNAKSMPRWPEHFAKCATHLRRLGVEVVNATRHTVLTCFPRVSLEDALGTDRLHGGVRQHRPAA